MQGDILGIRIAPLTASPEIRAALSALLIETVASGGSVSFMHPLAPHEADAFWQDSLASADRGERIVLGAGSFVCGTLWARGTGETRAATPT